MTQVEIRNDPQYYALMLAVRPSKNKNHIPFLHYIKTVFSGDETGFTKISLKVLRLFEFAHGTKILQKTVLFNDEDEIE